MIQKRICRLLLTTPLSNRAIADHTNTSHNTVGKYREILHEQGLSWEQVGPLPVEELDRLLNPGREQSRKRFLEPDWSEVHKDLARPMVTLALLYAEYVEATPVGQMSEREFRRRHERYARTLGIVMRLPRQPGEQMTVDYSGKRPVIHDAQTGKTRPIELWVGVIGASRRSFAHATLSQQLPDFIDSHVRALEYFGALPMLLVPDNLKAAVVRVNGKDGHHINPTYQRFADHYDVTVLPTRPRRPRDKATVENGVRLVQRWVLARLRNRVFFSLDELNATIFVLIEEMNARPMKRQQGRSRNELFEALDRPAMRPMPALAYEYGEWTVNLKVPRDYHIHFETNYYSVPHTLVGETLDLQATKRVIELYHRNRRVATHPRTYESNRTCTVGDHQPPSHRAFSEGLIEDTLTWGERQGEAVYAFLLRHLESNRGAAAINGFRGVKRLAREFGPARLNTACVRTLALGAISTNSLRSMLTRGIEGAPLPDEPANDPAVTHDNVRGAANYQ